MRSIFTVASKVRNGIFTALAGTLALGGLAQAQAASSQADDKSEEVAASSAMARVVCSGYLYFHHRLHRGNDGRLWYPQSVRFAEPYSSNRTPALRRSTAALVETLCSLGGDPRILLIRMAYSEDLYTATINTILGHKAD